jgi:hypothetical protein
MIIFKKEEEENEKGGEEADRRIFLNGYFPGMLPQIKMRLHLKFDAAAVVELS